MSSWWIAIAMSSIGGFSQAVSPLRLILSSGVPAKTQDGLCPAKDDAAKSMFCLIV
jgi:hypothetical protein